MNELMAVAYAQPTTAMYIFIQFNDIIPRKQVSLSNWYHMIQLVWIVFISSSMVLE